MLKRCSRAVLSLLMVLSVLLAAALPSSVPALAQPANPDLILATTTSTQDSGLLDVLVPMFEKQSGYKVKTISVGTGHAWSSGRAARPT